MLKKILINQKPIPVPVPLKTLQEVVSWVESTLVKQGQSITRIVFNGRSLSGERLEARSSVEFRSEVDETSKIEFQLETPTDLAVQALDAIHNLSAVILGGLKAQAVAVWQAKPSEKPAEVETVYGDVKLLIDLMEHLQGLVNGQHVDAAAVTGVYTMLKRVEVAISMARSNSDWKACARVFLNRLEPLLKDLAAESEALLVRILATRGPQGALASGQE